MNNFNFKIKDTNLARLINSFINNKRFSYKLIHDEDSACVIIYYKKKSYFFIEIYNDFVSRSIDFFKDEDSPPNRIRICAECMDYLDGLGLNKAHKELCKLLNVKIELSDDENCVLKLTKKENVERTDFSLKEKKKVGCKMKPYYLAFKDISFKDVRSKVKSNESLIKKYFFIQHIENYMYAEFQKINNNLSRFSTKNRKHFYEEINKILKDEINSLIPVYEWKWKWKSEIPIQRSSDRTTGSSIQVEPKQSLSQFIDEIIPKNTNTFKHSNPRITNKKQLQNYVSEYNNDKGFYEYLSASSNTQP